MKLLFCGRALMRLLSMSGQSDLKVTLWHFMSIFYSVVNSLQMFGPASVCSSQRWFYCRIWNLTITLENSIHYTIFFVWILLFKRVTIVIFFLGWGRKFSLKFKFGPKSHFSFLARLCLHWQLAQIFRFVAHLKFQVCASGMMNSTSSNKNK